MNCKYCNAPLEDGTTVCPECGRENAEPAPEAEIPAPAAEATPAAEPAAAATPAPEMKEGMKATPGMIALIVVGCVAVLALLAALIVWGTSGKTEEPTAPTSAASELAATQSGTESVPADTSGVASRASYTASDEEVVKANSSVVAVMGDQTLTNGQLQVYYWMQVYDFLDYYGQYAAYYGLDYTQPLDQQICPATNGTWEQYFLSCALMSWQRYRALSNVAAEENYAIPEEIAAQLDNLESNMAESAAANGFADAAQMLEGDMGKGCTLADYRSYLELYYRGYTYFQGQYENFAPTDAEIEAYFDQYADVYAQTGITKDTVTVDVRHVLLQPAEDTEESWAACEADAQALLDQWVENGAAEEDFIALAGEYSTDPGSKNNGGLYTGVTVGQMVQPFNDWCFDATRAYGDYGIVKTSYGFHLMFFVASTPQWREYAAADLLGELSTQYLESIVSRFPIDVDYSKILLGNVNLGGE